MRVPFSINNYVGWAKLLELLDVRVEAPVLPYACNCPLCNTGQLTVFNDENAGGAWAHCPECEFAGDMVELAAAYWKGLDLATTVYKLAAAGIPIPEDRLLAVNVDRYVNYHPGRRKRFKTLWEQARKRLLTDDSTVLRSLQQKLGIRLSLDRDRWLSGPGLFVGGSEKGDVERAFQPGVMERMTTQYQNAGEHRTFVGADWTDVLVIPFHDLPGRLKGFLFIGREGRIPEDVVFRLVRHSTQYIRDKRTGMKEHVEYDAGIAFFDAARHANDVLVVMQDPFLALKLHCGHLQDNSIPLPLVSTYVGNKEQSYTHVWSNFKQQKIFWGAPSADMFRHAHATNGLVCTAGFTNDGPIKSFTKTPAREWMERVRQEARPWDEVLEEYLDKLPLGQAETILLKMELSQAEVNKFLSTCPEELRRRLLPCFEKPQSRNIVVNDVPVKEEDGGWYNAKTGEQICNAILRIEQMVYHDKFDESFYAGFILFRGNKYPFYETADVVERSPFKWMRSHLLKVGAGYLNYSQRWDSAALAVATKFNEPQLIRGTNSIGWSEEMAAFVFPGFVINNKGDVEDVTNVKLPDEMALPARNLVRPVDLTTDEVEALSGPAAPMIWGCAVAVMCNLLAPVFGQDAKPIMMFGGIEESAVACLKLLGCIRYNATEVIKREKIAGITKLCEEHNWPVYLQPPRWHNDEWMRWLTGNTRKNCITTADWYTAQVLAATPGWLVLEANDAVAFNKIPAAVSRIIPGFLRYLTKRRFSLPTGTTPSARGLNYRILASMADWFASQGGSQGTVMLATEVLKLDDEAIRNERIVNAFTALLCKLYTDGELSLDLKSDKGLLVVPGDEGRIFVPKSAVNKLLVSHNAPMLDVAAISDALVARGLLVEEKQYGRATGWVIPRECLVPILSDKIYNKRR